MNLDIEINGINVDNLRAKGEAALDYLWKKSWLKESLNRADSEQIEGLMNTARKLTDISEITVIIATGLTAAAIESALEAVDSKQQIVVFGDNLSAGHYVDLINLLEGRDFTVVAISPTTENTAFKAAFACLRKLLIEKYGPSGAAQRIVSVMGHQKGYLEEEASGDEVKSISLPEWVETAALGNTAAILLPLAIAGGNLEEYLDGFRTMLADPVWDSNGTDYGLALAGSSEKEYLGQVVSFQKELTNTSKWFQGTHQACLHKTAVDTWLYLEKEKIDIALPSFPGCSGDGSLNVLLKEEIYRSFSLLDAAKPTVKITVPELSSFVFGQLFAFVQLSIGISTFILDN